MRRGLSRVWHFAGGVLVDQFEAALNLQRRLHPELRHVVHGLFEKRVTGFFGRANALARVVPISRSVKRAWRFPFTAVQAGALLVSQAPTPGVRAAVGDLRSIGTV